MWVTIDLSSWSIVISEADGGDTWGLVGGLKWPLLWPIAIPGGHLWQSSSLTVEANGNEWRAATESCIQFFWDLVSNDIYLYCMLHTRGRVPLNIQNMCIRPSQWKHESSRGFLFVCSPESLTALYHVLNLVPEFCVFLYRNKDVSTLNWCIKKVRMQEMRTLTLKISCGRIWTWYLSASETSALNRM